MDWRTARYLVAEGAALNETRKHLVGWEAENVAADQEEGEVR